MQLHTSAANLATEEDDIDEEEDQKPLQARRHRPLSILASASCNQLNVDLPASYYSGPQNSTFSTASLAASAPASCCSVFPRDLEDAANLAGAVQQEHYDQLADVLGALVRPPTMHPNLVTTLRALLSPPHSPIRSCSSGGRFYGVDAGNMAEALTASAAVPVVKEGVHGKRENDVKALTIAVKRESIEKGDGIAADSSGGERESERVAAGLMAGPEGKERENGVSSEEAAGMKGESGYGGALLKTTAAACFNVEDYKNMVNDEDDEVVATVVPVDLIRNRRPFTCSYEGCNKTFKNPQTMRMHFKTHYPGTDVCKLYRRNAATTSTSAAADKDQQAAAAASATNNNNNGSSKAGHNKKIPSRCPLCRKTFVGLYELRRHFGRKHSEGEKSHACRKCNKKFYIEVDLRDHEKLCGEPMQCKCGMKFAFKCNLVVHKKAHPECQDPTTPPLNINPYTHTLMSTDTMLLSSNSKPQYIYSSSIPTSINAIPVSTTTGSQPFTIYPSHKPLSTSCIHAFFTHDPTHTTLPYSPNSTSTTIPPSSKTSQYIITSSGHNPTNFMSCSAFSVNDKLVQQPAPLAASAHFYNARLETFKNVSDEAVAPKCTIAAASHQESHSPCVSSSKGGATTFASCLGANKPF
ncbi:hypothetical protein L7F22_058036 [Adiantum nelumboides]|nr:hypothetical protein [Adiantum nelumboides]